MNADAYYDPSYGVRELGTADFWCGGCETDTEHDFTKRLGLVTAWCLECGNDTEVEPD
jgi:hypothetical protein